MTAAALSRLNSSSRERNVPLTKPTRSRWQIGVGSRIRVRQQVTVGSKTWALEVSGIVREVKPVETGISTDRVPLEEPWVESVLLEKPDRELTRVTFDENTQVEVLQSAVKSA